MIRTYDDPANLVVVGTKKPVNLDGFADPGTIVEWWFSLAPTRGMIISCDATEATVVWALAPKPHVESITRRLLQNDIKEYSERKQLPYEQESFSNIANRIQEFNHKDYDVSGSLIYSMKKRTLDPNAQKIFFIDDINRY